MTNEHLQRVLRLIKKTGDKGFIIDPEADDMFVLMDVDSYEKILGTDSPAAPEVKEPESELDDYVLDDIIEVEERHRKAAPAEEAPVEPTRLSGNDLYKNLPAQLRKKFEFSAASDWRADDKKPNAVSSEEESLADVPHDEDEEKFYLEPVE